MGPGLAILLDNPLLILVIIFGLGGWFVYRMANAQTGSPGEGDGQSASSENSASKRGA